jgi:transposase-like protein
VPKLKARLGRWTKLYGWWVMKKRKFAREFKFEAVKLNTDRDVKVAQASQDLDVQSLCFQNGAFSLG